MLFQGSYLEPLPKFSIIYGHLEGMRKKMAHVTVPGQEDVGTGDGIGI